MREALEDSGLRPVEVPPFSLKAMLDMVEQ